MACAEENLKRGYKCRHIYICSDSQAAIKALSSFKIGSRLVEECREKLTKLSYENYVKILWVPGHSGIKGNEEADALAVAGANEPLIGPEPAFGISPKNVRHEIWNNAIERFQKSWTSSQTPRQARALIKGFSAKSTNYLLNLSRRQLKIVTGLLTGHGRLNNHLHTIGIMPNPQCRKCQIQVETSEHVLCKCIALTALRNKHLGSPFLETSEIQC